MLLGRKHDCHHPSSPRDGTSLPQSFTVCVSASPEERGRVAAALDGQGLLVLVPDAQMAVDLLAPGGRPRPGRSPTSLDEVVRLGRLEVDRRRATVTLGRHVARRLAPRAGGARPAWRPRPGVVWTYERLHEAAWGSRYVGDRDSVYSLVKRLRRKLAEAGVELDLLAVRGIGFQLVPQPAARALEHDAELETARARGRLTPSRARQSTSSGIRISTGVSDPWRPTSRVSYGKSTEENSPQSSRAAATTSPRRGSTGVTPHRTSRARSPRRGSARARRRRAARASAPGRRRPHPAAQ